MNREIPGHPHFNDFEPGPLASLYQDDVIIRAIQIQNF
jgi:hypothetical protein